MPQFVGPGHGPGFMPGPGFMRPGPGFEHHGWAPWFGWFMPILFLAALAGLVVWAVVRVTRRPPAPTLAGVWAPPGRFGPDLALEHARVRYARGELSREDFVRVTRDLGGAGPTPVPPEPPREPGPEPEAAQPEEPGAG